MKKVNYFVALVALMAVTVFTACEKNSNILFEKEISGNSVENNGLFLKTKTSNDTKVSTQIEMLLKDYQQVSTRSANPNLQNIHLDYAKLILVQSNENNEYETVIVPHQQDSKTFLVIAKDKNGNLSNEKILKLEKNDNNQFVGKFYDLYGTYLFSIESDVNKQLLTVVDYNKDRYTDIIDNPITRGKRAHSVGCSAAITAAGVPWSIGVGMAAGPWWGALVSVGFWAASEIMC